MLRRSVLLLATMAGCATAPLAPPPPPGYFTRLTGIISPALEYKPRGKISAEQAQDLGPLPHDL